MQKNKTKLPKCHLNDARADDKQVFLFHSPKGGIIYVMMSRAGCGRCGRCDVDEATQGMPGYDI